MKCFEKQVNNISSSLQGGECALHLTKAVMLHITANSAVEAFQPIYITQLKFCSTVKELFTNFLNNDIEFIRTLLKLCFDKFCR